MRVRNSFFRLGKLGIGIVLSTLIGLSGVVPQLLLPTVLADTLNSQTEETEIASLTPMDDALIDSSLGDTNLNAASGSSTGLFSVSSSSSKKKIVYFKFDLDGNVDAAYKYSFQVAAKKGSSNTDVDLSLYGLDNTDWSETSLTWNNAPAKQLDSGTLLGNFKVTTDKASAPEVYSVDVSDYVRSRLAQGKVAFMLGDASNTGVSLNIYSKEANGTSNPRPKLSVKKVYDVSSDKEAPVWPSGSTLSVTNLGTDFVNLEWPAATDNSEVTQYHVYRNDTLVATVSDVTYYNATGLSSGSTYSFKVEALDAAGNISMPLVLSRTTLDVPITPLTVDGVVASSNDGNIEMNTIDNNSYTRWSASGDGQWIMYDLGETERIGYVGIGFYKGDMRSTRFNIETSNDGSTWTQRFSGSSSGSTTAMQAFDIPDTDARYVRIIGHGNSDGSSFTSLTDVHIYAPFANGDTPVAIISYVVPGPPPGAIPFTKPGLVQADGTPHEVQPPHATTGRTINVLDYGADPADNGSDDRSALQAAINAAEDGDEVYLPNGTYNLLSAPDGVSNLMLKTGVNIRGESETGTVLKTSLNLVKNSTAFKSAKQHDLVVSNLTLTSTWDGAFSTDHKVNNPDAGGPDSMITIANLGEEPSYNITIDHVTVEKYRRMGIRIDLSHDVVVRESTFRNATDVGPGGSGYGVAMQGTPKADRLGYPNDTIWNLAEDNSFEGPYLRHGALIQFVAHNNTVRNNRFHQTQLDAVDLHGELEYLNDIYGNLVTDILTGGAVGLGNTGGTAPSNHSKSGPGNYIHDNMIRNTREGVSVSMGTPDTVIENNIIENTSDITGATGVDVLNGPGTIIKNNIIRSNTAPDYWAILLEHDNGDTNANYIGQGDPQNVQIVGNTITGNANGIQLQAGTGILLLDNVLDNTGTNFQKSPGVPVPDAPTLAASAADWSNDPVTVTLANGRDDMGIAKFQYKNGIDGIWTDYAAPITFSTEGVQKISARAIDQAGFYSIESSVTVKLDKTAPTISAQRTPVEAGEWNSSPVTVIFTCSDALSGVRSCPQPVTVATEGANQSVKGTAVDEAGNEASAAVTDINIDLTAPVIEWSGAVTYSVTQNVYLSCTAFDGLSGVASDTCAMAKINDVPAYMLGVGSHATSAQATDLVGNPASSDASYTITLSYNDLRELTRRFVLEFDAPGTEGTINSLLAKLDRIEKQDNKAKDNELSSYKNELSAIKGNKITADKADILLVLAEQL
jgi:hypothetical protein